MFENIFETVNAGFAQALYEEFLRDPAAVPPAWRELFESGVTGEEPVATFHANSDSAPITAAVPDEIEAESVGSSQPIKGPARRLLQNMEESLRVPTATSFRDINVGKLWNYRQAVNEKLKARDAKLSFTHVIGWAIVKACSSFPSMIHAVTEIDDEPHRFEPSGVSLGLAVDVERKDGSRGLLVPVIKSTNTMTFA